ncbi:MAG: Pr6Pr family membrane protein [Sediminibacterium sp.]
MNPKAKAFAALIALLGWFAIIMQFYLIIENRIDSIPVTILRFFSFFTILTNIIVAFAFTMQCLKKGSNHFFAGARVQTAVTVYIVVVGAVYNLILRFLWQPQGTQRLVDELLHSVVPFLSIIYWLVFVQKTSLQWKDSFKWQLFPVAYVVFIVVRGLLSGEYPYPFINVTAIGYPQALLNGCVLMLVFMGLSLFLIAIGKWISRKHTQML